MSEEKDCSSSTGLPAAGLQPATDEPHSAGCVGPTPGQIMHRVNAEQFKPNGWVDSYPTWEDYDDAGHAKWEEMARRFTFLSSGVSRSQSEAKLSASAFAQDEQKPQSAEGLDLAELKREIARYIVDLANLKHRLETAERERDEAVRLRADAEVEVQVLAKGLHDSLATITSLQAQLARAWEANEKLLMLFADGDNEGLHGFDHHDEDCPTCKVIAEAQDTLRASSLSEEGE